MRLNMAIYLFSRRRAHLSCCKEFRGMFPPERRLSFLRKHVPFRSINRNATYRNPGIRSKVMWKCLNVKRSPTSQEWSRCSLSNLSNGGIGDLFTKLDAAADLTSERGEKLDGIWEQLGKDGNQNLEYKNKPQEELLSSHGLPLSPLMDRRLIAARSRHRIPKPQPSGPPSALSEKLQKNPYGTYHHPSI